MEGNPNRPTWLRGGRIAPLLVMLAVVSGLVAAPTKGHAATSSSLPASFVTYPLSYPTGNAWDLRLGPDGRWWAPQLFGTAVDQVTIAGTDSSVQLGNFYESRITAGSDGNLWMTNIVYNSTVDLVIDKISPSGALLASYPTGLSNFDTNLFDIALGPDGNVWFAADTFVGRMTPTGAVATFPWAPGNAESITAGPDGNLWVADWQHADVGRITPSGVVAVFTVPTMDRTPQPYNITSGPDGNLWFTDITFTGPSGSIGRITPAGAITQFVAPNGVHPLKIATGPDGNLWFTDDSYGFPADTHIGRITTSGQIGVFDFSAVGGGSADNITAGPDGNVWLTLANPARVAAFQPFAPAAIQPDIRNISTPYSLPSGGGQVTITGYDVGSATRVLFGATPATSFSSLGPGQLVATVPPHAVGATDVTVETPYGTTSPSAPTPQSTGSRFYYQATNCGTVITQSTQLSGNIGPCYTGGLTVAADNVTLDLNGNSVVGFPGPRDGTAVGINLPQRSGVTVENGTVSGFNAGVHIGGGSGNTVAHMNIHDNIGPDDPNTTFGDGVMIEHGSRNNQIVHNVINHNGVFDGIGVYDPTSDSNTIAYNTVENTVGPSRHGPAGEGIIINGASGRGKPISAIHSSVVEHNTVSNNASGGIANINEIGGTIEYNTVTGNGTTNSFGNGIGVQIGYNWDLGPTQMMIEHNQVSGNGVDGIRIGGAFGFFKGVAEGNSVAYNVVMGNGTNPSADVYEGGPQGYDLHDNDPTCGTNVWLKNTWGSAGYTPPCTTAGGTGPSPPAASPHGAAPNAAVAKAAEAFLERGRS